MSRRLQAPWHAALLVLACLVAACGETPTQGFEDFYAALVDGDARVLERLDQASRRQVEDAARARGIEPARALAGGGVRSTLREIRERERTDHTATLEVEDALGNTEVVTMHKEHGHWRVALASAAAAATPAPEQPSAP